MKTAVQESAADMSRKTNSTYLSMTFSLVIVVVAAVGALFAQEFKTSNNPPAKTSQQSPFEANLPTVAGGLQIVEKERGCMYSVILGGKEVLATNCHDGKTYDADAPIPTILLYLKRTVRPFDEVVMLQQQMLGNACDGGPIRFLGLAQNGSFVLSSPIDFCGGSQPVITVGEQRITMVLPGGLPNRGKGTIPKERWLYENGKVEKLVSRQSTTDSQKMRH